MKRVGILLGLVAVMIVVAWCLPPIYQDPNYHHFADTRRFLGIPNFLDVVSNLPFLWAGLLGLQFVYRRRRLPWELKFPYTVFFAGVTAVAVGSAYYHWAPTSERLFWDRLPMSVAFSALVAGLIADRMNASAGFFLTVPLMVIGAASVVLWHSQNELGYGDLRFYAFVQFGTLVFLMGLLFLYPRGRQENAAVLIALAWYGLAKVLESLDRPIFGLGGLVGGHALKHLAAALSCYCIYRLVRTSVLARERS